MQKTGIRPYDSLKTNRRQYELMKDEGQRRRKTEGPGPPPSSRMERKRKKQRKNQRENDRDRKRDSKDDHRRDRM